MGNLNKPNIRFPEFEREWIKNTLGEIAGFSKGKGLSKSDISENGATECIRYGELYTTYNETIDAVYSKTNINPADLVLSEANDIIVPASGETHIDIAKASCVLKSGVALGGDLNIIKTSNNGVFLSYYLNSKKKNDIAQLAQGISVVHLYSGQISKLLLNLPSLPEQQKIASLFTAIDHKLYQLKQKKILLEQYKKGVMQKIFSQEIGFKDEDGQEFPKWEKKRLDNVISNFIVPMRDKPKELKGDIPWCRIEDFDGKYLVKSKSNQGVNKETVKRMNLKVYPVNTLLVSCSANLGFCSIVKKELVTNQTFIGLVPNGNAINVEFLFYVMVLSARKLNSLSSGTTISYLSREQFEKFNIQIPSQPEQTKIANFLSAIDDKINHTQKQIEKAEVWKKGLMQQMFV
jgi:type I restriction enzyme S subunit